MVEQLTDGDLVGARAGQLELRQMVLDRVVQVQQTGVDELHHRSAVNDLLSEAMRNSESPVTAFPVVSCHSHAPSAPGRRG